MINLFLRHKCKNLISNEINLTDIKNSRKIIFCLFTRYGDTVISLCVLKEFIENYPDKDFLILCPNQMKPYVEEILPAIKVLTVNKRNLFQMFLVNSFLKKWQPDIGFCPWSNGLDGCFFSSYARKYYCYKDFRKPLQINHYNVIRKYLKLKQKPFFLRYKKLPKTPNSFLICPESTDEKRSLSISETEELIEEIRVSNANAIVTLATMKNMNCKSEANFIFQKDSVSSSEFIKLVKKVDIVISVDSAPLHIALALNIDTIPIFKITNQKNVINSNSEVVTGLINV